MKQDTTFVNIIESFIDELPYLPSRADRLERAGYFSMAVCLKRKAFLLAVYTYLLSKKEEGK